MGNTLEGGASSGDNTADGNNNTSTRQKSRQSIFERLSLSVGRKMKKAGERPPADLSKVNLVWDATPEQLIERAKEIIQEDKAVEDSVAEIPLEQVTFENTAQRLIETEVRHFARLQSIEFLQHVSMDTQVRKASVEAEKLFSEYAVVSSMRKDVYERIAALRDNEAEMSKLNPEQVRYVERVCRDYERKGLALDDDARELLEKKLKRISELGIQYSNNIGEENTILEMTRDELEGMPDDFFDSLELTEDGTKYKVTLKYPHSLPILRSCKRADTRARMEFAYNRRCYDTNPQILEELVQLRAETAQVLGFENHADYVLAIRMAKDAKTVRTFLDDLNERLSPLADQEMKELLELKQKECEERGEGFDGRINMYDFRYYAQKREEQQYNIDHEIIKEYFPLGEVITRLLDLYQDLLSLEFVEVFEDSKKWHEEVRMFQVIDRSPQAKEPSTLGYFYLDLHPREGKYGHAACFTLQQACEDPSDPGQRVLPVCACVCNFPRPNPSNPKSSLLPFTQVVTFFHEFGHCCHVFCSKTQLPKFSGTRVERDFVEAPSQMLENWCWQPESLAKMSCHYESKKPIPEDLALKLAKSEDANTGLLNKRQLVFANFDQAIHTISPGDAVDTAAIVAEMQETIMGIPSTKDTNFAASFGHMVGYDAQYFGYLWSEVYSMDMFATKFKSFDGKMNHLFDPKVGMEYRKSILEPGGSKDAIELLQDFLGRPPNQEAFLRSKGLST